MHRGFLLLTMVAATACQPNNIGTPCAFPRADGGYFTDGELRLPAGGRTDVIYLRAVECDDAICVRDLTVTAAADQQATGYCSRECTAGQACEGALTCQALLLDTETLARLPSDAGFPTQP